MLNCLDARVATGIQKKIYFSKVNVLSQGFSKAGISKIYFRTSTKFS